MWKRNFADVITTFADLYFNVLGFVVKCLVRMYLLNGYVLWPDTFGGWIRFVAGYILCWYILWWVICVDTFCGGYILCGIHFVLDTFCKGSGFTEFIIIRPWKSSTDFAYHYLRVFMYKWFLDINITGDYQMNTVHLNWGLSGLRVNWTA